MGNGIAKARAKRGYTQKQLAELIGCEALQISKWERNWEEPPPATVRDIALALDTSAESVLGSTIPVEGWADCPYAVGEHEPLFGGLHLKFTHGEHSWPISRRAYKSLTSQLGDQEVDEQGGEGAWLYVWTLDDRLIFANPRYLRSLKLVDDDEAAAPDYEHPEVYRALIDWDVRDDQTTGPLLKEACETYLREFEDEEEGARPHLYLHIVYDDGSDEWVLFYDEWAATAFHALELNFSRVKRSAMQMVAYEGGSAQYVSLDRVALIEVPAQQYHRLTAPQ